MKKKIRIKRYQDGGLNYLNTNPQLMNPKPVGQVQGYPMPRIPVEQMQQQTGQQAGQFSSQPSVWEQNKSTIGKTAGMAGSMYYGSQQANNPGDDQYNKTMAGVSQAGPIGGVIGGVSAIGDAIGKPIRANAEKQNSITGAYQNDYSALKSNAAGSMVNPYKMTSTIANDPYATKGDKALGYLNMATPGLFAVIEGGKHVLYGKNAKGYTKRHEAGLIQEKQIADWNKSIANRQPSNQYNYSPTFQTGGTIEEDSRMKDLDFKDWTTAIETGNKKNYPNLVGKDKLQDEARLYYYSQQLNKKLKEKNPDVYENLQNQYGWKEGQSVWDNSNNLYNKTRVEGAESYAKKHSDFYISPDEQKTILGNSWDDYNSLRGKYGKALNIIGQNEDPTKPETWKVGARHSVAFNPSSYGLVIDTVSEKAAKQRGYKSKKFDYSVTYDPNQQGDNKYITDINRAKKDIYASDYKMYPYGGYHTNYGGNAELEDNEIFRVPDGTLEKVNGRSHAQGGENYNLPQNTEILGKNKAPNGKSYKDNGDILMRQFNKFTKILENKPTSLAKHTANLMLDKVQKNYTNLMNMQEMEKQNSNSMNMFPYGGLINNTGYLRGSETEDNGMNIIPSNYITTDNMSKPISAMSNTGDYRDLYPDTGEYEFGGDYVMEQPLEEYKRGGIHINPKNKGKFNALKKRTGKTTAQLTHSSNPLTRKRAIFAQNAKKWKHSDGGYIYQDGGLNEDDPTYLNRQPNYRGFISNQDANTAQGFFGNDFNDVVETREGAPRMMNPRGINSSGMPNPIKGTTGQYELKGTQHYSPGQEHTRFVDETPDAWYNKVADTAGQYAPAAYNLYQGMFGKAEHMNAQDYYNPYENQTMSLMRSRRYNVEPELEANRLAAADYYQNLRQGAPSQGRYLAGLQSGQIGRQRGDAEAYARKQNMDNQYIGEEAQTLGGFGQQRAGMNFQVADINAANRAAQRKYLPTGLVELQQQTQMNKIMREKKRLAMNKALTDEERNRLYMEAFKGYSFSKRINPITGEEN